MRKKLKIFIMLFFVFFYVSSIESSAANLQKVSPIGNELNTVYSDIPVNYPNLYSYPYNSDTINNLSFFDIYGIPRIIKYYGEIPYINKDNEGNAKLRYYSGNSIAGINRIYSDTDKGTITAQDEDLHIKALTKKSGGFFNFGSVAASFSIGLASLVNSLIGILIYIKSFNLGELIQIIDKDNSFTEVLVTIFIKDAETGAYSPLFMLSLICFIVSLVSLAFKTIKGQSTFKTLIEEVSIFAVAFILAGFFLDYSNPSNFSKNSVDFLTSMTNDISVDTKLLGSTTSLYVSDTSNEKLDASNTQIGLLSMNITDAVLRAQFGYSVSDLYIIPPEGYEKGFGDISPTVLGEDFNFRVYTGNESYSDNLAYWFAAAASGVEINQSELPISSNSVSESSKWTINRDSQDRILFVVDYLEKVRTDGDDALKEKAERIMDSISEPSYKSVFGNVLVLAIRNCALFICLAFITVFSFMGQLIVAFGSYFMIIMPIIMLAKPVRAIAKKMVYSYLFGFVRFLVGSALFNACISIALILANTENIGTMVVSVFLFLIIAKFSPKLLSELNDYITRVGRGKELSFVSGMNDKFNRKMGNFGERQRGSKRRSRSKTRSNNRSDDYDNEYDEENSENENKDEKPEETEEEQQADNERDNRSSEEHGNKKSNSKNKDEKPEETEEEQQADNEKEEHTNREEYKNEGRNSNDYDDSKEESLDEKEENIDPDNESSGELDIATEEIDSKQTYKFEDGVIDDFKGKVNTGEFELNDLEVKKRKGNNYEDDLSKFNNYYSQFYEDSEKQESDGSDSDKNTKNDSKSKEEDVDDDLDIIE